MLKSIYLIECSHFPLKISDEKTDAYLQTKEELEHKNSQYEKLRKEVSSFILCSGFLCSGIIFEMRREK